MENPQQYHFSPSSVKKRLRKKRKQFTSQRNVILQEFQFAEQGTHFSAQDMYEHLQDIGESVSKPTVYRCISILLKEGLVRELSLNKEEKRYEINRPYPHHHHHLVCTETREVVEFKDSRITAIVSEIAKEQGYEVTDCQLTVYGLGPKGQRIRQKELENIVPYKEPKISTKEVIEL